MVSGELEQGEFVQLRFSLSSSSHVLELRARVCHRRGCYCGFEFLVVSDAQREQINLACEGLPAKESQEGKRSSRRAATRFELRVGSQELIRPALPALAGYRVAGLG